VDSNEAGVTDDFLKSMAKSAALLPLEWRYRHADVAREIQPYQVHEEEAVPAKCNGSSCRKSAHGSKLLTTVAPVFKHEL
jgi:hypothetical protein